MLFLMFEDAAGTHDYAVGRQVDQRPVALLGVAHGLVDGEPLNPGHRGNGGSAIMPVDDENLFVASTEDDGAEEVVLVMLDVIT